MPVQPANGYGNGFNGWGGDWMGWIVLFLIFGMFGWGGMGGFGWGGGILHSKAAKRVCGSGQCRPLWRLDGSARRAHECHKACISERV